MVKDMILLLFCTKLWSTFLRYCSDSKCNQQARSGKEGVTLLAINARRGFCRYSKNSQWKEKEKEKIGCPK